MRSALCEIAALTTFARNDPIPLRAFAGQVGFPGPPDRVRGQAYRGMTTNDGEREAQGVLR